jgi:hypothetical protein
MNFACIGVHGPELRMGLINEGLDGIEGLLLVLEEVHLISSRVLALSMS